MAEEGGGTVDLATLGLKVDSTEVPKASDALDKLAGAAGEAGAATDKLAASTDKLAESTKSAGAAESAFTQNLRERIADLNAQIDAKERDMRITAERLKQQEQEAEYARRWTASPWNTGGGGGAGPPGGGGGEQGGWGEIAKGVAVGELAARAAQKAIEEMAEAVKRAIVAWAQLEESQIHFQAMLEVTGNTAQTSLARIMQIAEELQRTTTFASTDILNAGNAMLKFGDISGASFERAIKLSADLAAVLGTTVTHAADLVGRALENSYGTMMLRRMGLLTDAQVAYLKSLNDLGEKTQAQAAMFDMLEAKAGGMAEKIGAHGLAGAWQQLRNEIGSAYEDIGKQVARWGEFEEILRGAATVLHEIREFKFADIPIPDWLKAFGDFKLPSISLPAIATPQWLKDLIYLAAEWKFPSITIPEISLPEWVTSILGLTDWRFPSISLPEVPLPEWVQNLLYLASDWAMPTISLPDLVLPKWLTMLHAIGGGEWKMPSISLPDIKVPPWLDKLWDIVMWSGSHAGLGGAITGLVGLVGEYQQYAEPNPETTPIAGTPVVGPHSITTARIKDEELRRDAERNQELAKILKQANDEREKGLSLQQREVNFASDLGEALNRNSDLVKRLQETYAGMTKDEIVAAATMEHFRKETESAATAAQRLDLKNMREALAESRQAADEEVKAIQNAGAAAQQEYAERIQNVQALRAANQISAREQIELIAQIKLAAIAAQRETLEAQMQTRIKEYNVAVDAEAAAKTPEAANAALAQQSAIRKQMADITAKQIGLDREVVKVVGDETTALTKQYNTEAQRQVQAQAFEAKTIINIEEYINKINESTAKIGLSAEQQAELNARQAVMNQLAAAELAIRIKIAEAQATATGGLGFGMNDRGLGRVTSDDAKLWQAVLDNIQKVGPALIGAAGAAGRFNAEAQKAINAWRQVGNDLYGAFTDFFVNISQKGTAAFKDLWDWFKAYAIRTLAEIAARQIVVSIIGSIGGVGGLAANAFLSSAGGTGLTSLLTLGSGANLLSGGAGTNWMNSLLWGSPGTSVGTASVLDASGWLSAEGFGSYAGMTGSAATTGLLGSGGTSIFSAAGPLGALGPVLPIIGAVALIGSLFMKKGGGPMTREWGTSGTDIGEFADMYSYHRLYTGAQQTAAYNQAATTAQTGYLGTYKALGGTGAPNAQFAIYTSQDPRGTAPNQLDVGAMLNGRMVYRANIEDQLGRDPAVLQARLQLETKRAILAALQASDLPKNIADIINSVDAATATSETIDKVLAYAAAISQLDKAIGNLDFDKISEAVDKAAAAGPIDAWKQQGADLQTLVQQFDGSTEATQALTQATVDYYNSTIKLLVSLKQLKDQIDQTFQSAEESIYLSGRDKGFQYEYYRQQADVELERIKTETDPERIRQETSSYIDKIMKMWNLLTPEQQELYRGQFIQSLKDVNEIADARIKAIGDQITTDAQNILNPVKTILENAAASFVASANTNLTASSNNLTASNNNLTASRSQPTVHITVTDRTANGANVTGGQ